MTLDPYSDAELAEATAAVPEALAVAAAKAVDRKLRATAGDVGSYEADAEAIARILRRHYGDEAGEVLRRAATKADAL